MRAILLLLVALLGLSQAQLTIRGKFSPSAESSPRTYTLPRLDNKVLLAKEDASHGGYQFGYPVDFALSFENDGFWTVLPGGHKLWTLTVKSEGALNLGITFEGFYIPEGGELFIVGEQKTLGAYSAQNNHADGRFTSFPLVGSSVTLQYFQSADVKESASINVAKVTHGYKPLNFGDSGSCNNNVACDDGSWANEIRSVGMLLSGFGSRFCSGALVNNAEEDGTQYFLTANHCSPDSADLIMFNYQSPVCTPNTDGPTDDVIGGLVRLASNTYSDFTILRIDEPIPASWNVFLSGLSAVNVAPASMVGIHHPSGDIKKISWANKAGIPDKWNAVEPGNWHWRISSWDDGTTEPGSSGSPLFDQNQRVVGQLHGGAASCLRIDYDSYGATWASWTNGLSRYLDPNGTGAVLINGTDLNALRRF